MKNGSTSIRLNEKSFGKLREFADSHRLTMTAAADVAIEVLSGLTPDEKLRSIPPGSTKPQPIFGGKRHTRRKAVPA